jgi:acyl-CoA synthetase (AMP-forming)/AMP-acid ligase II
VGNRREQRRDLSVHEARADFVIRRGDRLWLDIEAHALSLAHERSSWVAGPVSGELGPPGDAASALAGEIPASSLTVAYVVLKQGQNATAADIQGFVAEKVASYKQVRKLTFVDAIPKSASGKILRRVLRDQATQ